jgi:serine/threonine-protein kinase
MQHLQPKTTLQGGKYRIERVLGQGGFGITYLGYNTETENIVAIKEFFMRGVSLRENDESTVSISVPDNRDCFFEQKEKFKKEATRIRKLNNPYIVKVHDLFEENGTAYYVMDYVDGENLSDRLKRTGKPMSEREVRKILPQILDALKAVHDTGIWHLDLKPANILLDKEGGVKLIDFGASKQLNLQKGGATTSTAISYTNGYAPREQMEQNYDKFGPWTDIYALGATLYDLLTNKRPPLPTDIDDDITEDKHVSLPFPESVSNEMRSSVLWMMNTNRTKRPQKIDAITKVRKDKEDADEETLIASPQSEVSVAVHKEKTGNRHTGALFFGFIAICVVSFLIYLANSKSDDTNQTANEYYSTNTKSMSTVELFDEKMSTCSWNRNTSGTYSFKYPDFMSSSSYFMNEAPGEVEVYSWRSVQLAHWPCLGNWAIDIAESGNWIAKNAQITNVTYQSKRQGIYSGYTTDGRIYYLKTKLIDDGDVYHATVLALIYPEEFKEHMQELTEVVRRW